MTWTGDIGRMGQLAANIRRLGSVPSRAAARVSEALADLIDEEFATGTDPYGRPWRDLAPATLDKGRTPPPLTDTWAMRESVHVAPLQGAGVGITIDHPAACHQTGWTGPQGTGPARPILPGGRMPARWKAAIDTAIAETIRGGQ